MKGNNENNSINRRKGVKEWHVVDDDVGSAYNDAGSVENLMEDLKDISIDEEETLISEQMISESKLWDLATAAEMDN